MAICGAANFNGVHEVDRSWPNWNGDVTFHTSEYFEPAHSANGVDDGLTQLVHVVAHATDEHRAVHTIGSGWAFETLASSDDWIVCLESLNRVLEYVTDPGGGLLDAADARQRDAQSDRVLLHVEAGIRIADLSEELDRRGLALPTLGGSNGQALGGVISTSTHGGDWQQPPFPDMVRAVHLVGEGGQEIWIERASDPITDPARLAAVLPCPGTDIRYDDRLLDAVTVACGRFGVVYSYVLEVRRAFRVVEVVTTPSRAAVLQALRDGIAAGTLLQPLFDAMATAAIPAGLADATGTPSFVQVLFNSQDPQHVWVHRRWETTDPTDIPAVHLPTSGTVVEATSSSHDTAVAVLEGANAALTVAALTASAIPFAGPILALEISGVQIAMNADVASRPFTLGSVVTVSSTVRSPSASQNSFFTYVMIESSSSSPAMRIDSLDTMPPSEMTATLVVPPPTSTTMLPAGSCTGSPAPIAGGHGLDDVGGSRRCFRPRTRPPPPTAVCSTPVIPMYADHHAGLRPAARVHLLDEVAEHLLADVEVGDHAVLQWPDGLDVTRACARSSASPPPRPRAGARHLTLIATTEGSSDHAAAVYVDEGVGGAEVDRHVAAHD